MKVADLIDKLRRFNPDMDVAVLEKYRFAVVEVQGVSILHGQLVLEIEV